MHLTGFSWFYDNQIPIHMVWYGMYVWYGMVSMHKSIKGGFRRSWISNRAPYNIVCLDYLVYLVYIATGSIGGNGSIRLPVVSVVSGYCRIS